MTEVFHVVGEFGSGKSSLILKIAAWYSARNVECAGLDPYPIEGDVFSRAEAIASHPNAGAIFIEHRSLATVQAERGDMVIRVERGQGWPTHCEINPRTVGSTGISHA